MFNEFLNKSNELYTGSEPFAIAFVVNRQVPSSGKPGDKAVIEKNGKITGWIGGGCTRGIVLKEALLSIKDGKPRLVRISPDGKKLEESNVVAYSMTCHSGGAVEIYIEPVLPKPHLLIMGKSHVAMALHKIGKAMEYKVSIVSKGADKIIFPEADLIDEGDLKTEHILPNTCIVVCTQGENDELALEQAVKSSVPYVAFVSSRKKANAIFRILKNRGVTFEELKKIKTPAGLDINAKLPEEVAISILAEIIQHMRGEEKKEAIKNEKTENNLTGVFINPVCGIPVEKNTAKHIIQYDGEDYFFCCDGCKVKFEAEPEKYVAMAES
ncbi:MAG: XdhC family protein [Bacteroidota bacterium]